MDKHTPTPWKAASPQVFMGVTCVWIHGANGPVLKIEGSLKESVLADAAFIVRAVNAHEALLAALKDLLHQIETNGERREFVVGDAVQAIAKAEGKQ